MVSVIAIYNIPYLADGTALRLLDSNENPENLPNKPLDVLSIFVSSEARIPFDPRGTLLTSDTPTSSDVPYSSCKRQHERMHGKATKV